MDKDATWYGRRPRPRRLCVRWGTQLPHQKRDTAPNFWHYCGQTAWSIRIPVGTEVGLGPGDIVLDEDPALPPLTGGHMHVALMSLAYMACLLNVKMFRRCARNMQTRNVDLGL